MTEVNAKLIELTANIVSNYVLNNATSVTDMPSLISGTFAALASVQTDIVEDREEAVAKATPAQIRRSISREALISFEDGKPYRTLKRHLTTHGLTTAEYKAKWGLPSDYPITAQAYSEARSALAKTLGLGQGGRKAKAPGKARPKT